MKNFKYLIVGGGIAGTTAAETLRKEDPDGSVVIVSDEPHPLYSRVMLSKPNFFLEKVPFETIWLRKPEWYAQQQIEFFSGVAATALDPAAQTVVLANGETLHYEKLLLAVGSAPRRLQVPGADKHGVNYVKTVEDAQAIIANVKLAKRAVVVGAGFISFEMLDMLHLAGLEVESVVREPYFWSPQLNETAGRMVENYLTKAGIKVHLNSEVAEILGDDRVTGVVLKNGERLDCEIVILGIGVQFAGDWLKTAGVQVNRGIVTDEFLKTNLPNIWAAGDVAEFKDVIFDCQGMCGLWLSAQLQGKTAAMNMTGRVEMYRHLSSYIASGFGLQLGFVGQTVVAAADEVIERGVAISGDYTVMIVRGGNRVVGGSMVNAIKNMAPVTHLVESRLDVSAIKDKLADQSFDLSTLK